MKLTGRVQVESLAKFKSGGMPTTSIYVDTDKSRLSKKEIAVSFRHLLTEARTSLENMDAAREMKDSLCGDLDKIEVFGARDLGNYSHQGLAIFSCSRLDRWEPLFLPHGPRNRIIMNGNFYVRPLLAILEKYHRICVLLINRREARWHEVHMGEIRPIESLTSDVPGRVKGGGFEGNESKRIERHIEAHIQEHFKKASQTTFDLFKAQPFEWFFLGCEDDTFPILEPLLHAYLKDRLKGRLKAKPSECDARILQEVVELETRLMAAEESEAVGRLVAELERGGRACSGLRETLQSLNRFEVQSLVVTHNFSKEGRVCPACRFLYIDEQVCPIDQKPTKPVVDVVDEAIETVMKRGCAVRQISSPSKLDRYGKIGAFLKYKT